MPTITHTARATIGGSQAEFQQPRTSVKAATGMGMPSLSEPEPAAPDPKTGQPTIKEDTNAPAVTLSPQLTALARKQQALQREIQAQRDKEAAFAKEKADYIPRSSVQAKMREDAESALKETFGMGYEEITNLLIAQKNGTDPVQALRSEIDQLKSAQEQNVSKQYDATLKQYRAETESLTSSDPKSFFFINKEKQHDAVVQHIVDTWKEDDTKILTVEQAAKEIEEFLREEARAKKAALEELDGPPAKPAEKTLPPPQAASPRTLTRQVEAAPTRTHNQFQHLSMKERIEQSIARAQK